MEEKRIEAFSVIDRVKDTYRKHATVIGFRCGVVCHLLSGDEEESKATLQFATAMAELTLQGQMRIFGDDLRAQLEEGSPREGQRAGCNKTIFEQLPPVFTMDDLSQLKGSTCSSVSLRSVVSRWTRSGWTEKK